MINVHFCLIAVRDTGHFTTYGFYLIFCHRAVCTRLPNFIQIEAPAVNWKAFGTRADNGSHFVTHDPRDPSVS